MNIEILHPSLPRRRIQEWIYNYNKFGKNYFIPEDKPYTINDSFKQQLYKIVNGEL